MTHLRQQMLDELQRRNYSQSTVRSYIFAVEDFARYIHRSPERLGPGHIRQYQAYLFRERKLSPGTIEGRTREKFFDWKEHLLPKHPMAEAIKYALGNWEELNAFVADGAVAIDNNVSEREMKRIVLNRKNSLFGGNARGGRSAAILASLTSSCRRHDVDPQLYLTQLLVDLPSLRISDLPDWLPDRWRAAQNVRLTGFAQEREFAR